MYQNIYVKRTKTSSEVHIWDDKTGYSKFQYKPYAYLKSQSGTYRSLYGDKLKKVNFWTGDDLPPKIIYTTRSHGWSTTKLKDLITKQTIKQNPKILK